jgi:hypothetical protein
MDKKVISREYISTTRCDLMDDGYWKATNEVADRVLFEGEEEWLDERVDAMAMDSNPKSAIKTSMESVLNYLLQNVYNNGFDGLIEYREFQNKLAEKKEEANRDTEVTSLPNS